MALDGVKTYWQAVHALQQEILNSQSAVLDAVASAMQAAIQQDHLLFLFGTGHSHMLAEEGHYRAGSLAAFVPLLLPAVMLHESAQKSSAIERTSGLAAPLLERYAPRPQDMLFIFSNSGVNQMPVEMAQAARERGMVVVAVCSVDYARQAPLSSVGKRLDELADFTIDNRIPPGDALVSLPDSAWRVAPASTLIGSFILNSLVAEVAFRLQAVGATVPVFISSNMAGADAHNQTLLNKWGKFNPHI